LSAKKDGAGVRRERVNILLDLIEANPEATEYKLMGLFTLKTGLSKRAMESYIEELILFEVLKREGNRLSSLLKP